MSSAIDTCSAHIIALTETWLSPDIQNSEIFEEASHFNIYRYDRTTSRGGGALLAISNKIPSSSISVSSNLEIIWASGTVGHRQFIFGVCYRSPSSSTNFVNELHDVLNEITTRFPTSPVILLGDFNYPNITWNTNPPTLVPFSTESQEFLDMCSTFSLTQVVSEPTRLSPTASNTLDLVLTTTPDLISAVTCFPGISDHLLLNFHIKDGVPERSKKCKTVFDYNRANFNAISTELDAFTDVFLSNFNNNSLQSNWDAFENKVHELIEKYIPKRVITTHSHAPWYNIHIKRLSNKKKRLYCAAKRSPSSLRWNAYKTASEAYLAAIKTAKENFLSNVLPSMLASNVKKF